MHFLKILRKLPWDKIVPIFLIISAVGYGLYGFDTSVFVVNNTIQNEADRLVEDFKKSNPVYATEIEKLRDQFGAPAIATKLKLDNEALRNSMPIQSFKDHLKNNTVPSELPLVHLALNTHLVDNDQVMTAFLENFYPSIAFQEDEKVRQQILTTLNEASKSPRDWKVVSNHFSGPLVWQSTRNYPELWNYYAGNHSWLEEPILMAILNETQVTQNFLQTETQYNAQERLRQYLTIAQEYENIFVKLRGEFDEQLAFVFNILELHGGVVQIAVNRNGLPAGEVIEILFANPGYLEIMTENDEQNRVISENGAAYLADIYRDNQNVWNYAKTTPLALQLYDDAPDQADKVLEKYGQNPAFFIQLYDNYDIRNDDGISTTMPHVAESLIKYGDLAAHILYKYRDNKAFKEVLANPNVGFRAIPFVARYPDQLMDLKNDSSWVNKYFDETGKHIDDERWYEAIPVVGSVGKVAVNWANGVPCSWSEIGWAAFDAVDVALICVSAGASTAITGTIKSGIKYGSRTVGKGMRFAGRGVGKIGDAFSWVKRTRIKGVQTSFRSRRGLTLMKSQASDDIYERFIRSADNIANSINDIPPVLIRFSGYVLAGYKVYSRSEVLGEAPEQIGAFIGKFSKEIIQGAGELIANTVKEFIPKNTGNYASPLIFHIFIISILLILSLISWRLLKRKQVNQL